MILIQLNDNLTATLDPTGHYAPISVEKAHHLIESLGFIPAWLSSALDYPNIRSALIDQYQYYMGDFVGGGEIDSNGVYTFPDDPPLYPIIEMKLRDETFYQYPYGIVATVNDNGEKWISRFD